MKRLTSLIVLACLFGFVNVGCNKTSKEGGKADAPGKGTFAVSTAEDTFTFEMPKSVTLKQGETSSQKISVSRGKNFKEGVKFTFEKMPAGVDIDPKVPEIKDSATEVTINIKAAEKAAVGVSEVTVKGDPEKSTKPATSTFKITVVENK